MYYIMATEAGDENDMRIHGQPDIIKTLNIDFGLGQLITQDIPPIPVHIKKEDKGRYTDNLIAKGTTGLVFNSKIRNLLSDLGIDNIQYFDAIVIDDESGESNKDYKIANIVGAIDCIDSDKSELVYRDNGSIKFIDKLVLDSDRTGGLPIFRLSGYLPIVVIDEAIKTTLIDKKISGINIYNPEEYVL